ncbi:hypothetical protein MSL71_6400 [Desulfoluna butyratoxydans]|uniref:Uncharacterized protein n=2 Tax=Desulfoluna butyratoxydans TaxID=231438 RepID=A0A4V6IKZ3_9BACT|nr:hypothetical protein MSL71_6400 [Desulfoluna butyratoxydans]
MGNGRKGESMRQLGTGRALRCAGRVIAVVVAVFAGTAEPADALKPLNDAALAMVDAQAGPVTISVEQDTVRIFFDTYIKTYVEADQVRMGYYYKDKTDLVTRKGMNPGVHGGQGMKDFDPRINQKWKKNEVVDGHRTFKVDYRMYGGEKTPERYAMEYQLFKEGELETEYVPWTDDDLFMAKYKVSAGQKLWVDGVQADNDATLLGIPLFYFSEKTYQNRNYLDWDISLDNLRLGASPDNPAEINGLVIRLKYDNINDPDRRLTDIIIGTNDLQADLMVDFRRATGLYSPKNAYRSRQVGRMAGIPMLQGSSDLAKEFNSTPVPVILQRDSMLMLVDHYYFGRDYRVPDGESYMAAVPDNPTNSNTHNGMFLRIGLDRESPHFGYQIVTGYNELVATSFQYRGEHINESLYKWWHGEPHAEATHTYPSYLPQDGLYTDNSSNFNYHP